MVAGANLSLSRLLDTGIHEVATRHTTSTIKGVAVLHRRVGQNARLMAWKLEARLDLILDELRAVLEPLITVLFENRRMMLKRHLATIKEHVEQRLQLTPRVAGIVDMGRGL